MSDTTGSNRRGGRGQRRGARRARITRRILIEALEHRTLLSTSTIVFPGADGRLVYAPNAQGDFIPDFSMVGYETGSVALPDTTGGLTVPVKQTINPGAAGVDMTATIQNAINAVAALTPDANGFRGAIQLNAGNYPISGSLNITAGGVVLIGAGNNATTGTRLEATGTAQRFLINIAGSNSQHTASNSTHNILGYVPVGATSFQVDSTANLHVGDMVIVDRPSTAAWIHDIGMDTLTNPWQPGSKNLDSDRVITAVNGTTITIDAPLTNSLDPQYGGGTIHGYTYNSGGARIQQVGIMNMYTYSDYTGSPGGADTDTTHATGVITMDDLANSWVENITADNFALNVIEVGGGAKSVTLDHLTIQNTSQAQSNIDDAPAGLGSSGQEILVENSTFTNAYHAIALGATFAGPSVYTNITITDPLEGALNLSHSRDETGPHQRWSTGGLFDDVSNTDWINVRNAGNEGSGHGWQGANYVFWNVNARTDISSPPTAQNWIIGGTASTSEGTGVYDQRGSTVFPLSLYQTQLWDRLHVDPVAATSAAATPNPLNGGTSVNLSVLGAEAGLAESNLTYTWAVTSKPSGAATPTFTVNGTNASKSTSATLSQTGTYIFVVTIQDPGGLKTTSTVVVTPGAATVINGDQDFANENDTIRIVRNGTFVDVFLNNPTTPILHQDYASSPELVIDGLGGNDTITVDYSGGNPIPAAGLVIDGGSGTNDVVSIAGSTGNDAVTLSSGGSVTVNGGQFGYTNFEEMDMAFGAGTDTLTASGAASVSTTALVLNVSGGGTLSMANGSTLPNFADVNVNGATFDLHGQSQTVDALNGNGTVLTNTAAATLTTGQQNSGGTFSGSLQDGSGVFSLTKVGSGELTLSGANSFTGNTTIAGGAIASGNAASLAGLSGTVIFNGGTFHVTANTVAANVTNKFTTSFTGATGSSTGVFNIDAAVTLTIGVAAGPAAMRTNGGGAHGGDFTKTGAGTLKILSNNGQQDNVFHLTQGSIDLESATGLGGGDAGVSLSMSNGTTLILKQDTGTNFLTPINIVDAGATVNLVIDRQSAGAGVTHQLNSVSSSGAFTISVSAGANVTSGLAGFTIGTLALGGAGTVNVGSLAAMTVTGVASGAFTLAKSGIGALGLNAVNTYTGDSTVTGGTLTIAAGGSIASANVTVAAGATLNVNGSLPSTVTINDSGTVNFIGNTGTSVFTRSVAALNIAHGGLAKVLASAFPLQAAVLNVTTLTLADATAKLDLTNNELTVTAAASAMRAAIIAGELFTSSGGGVLGYLDLGGGLTEVRFTLAGDTNLDGKVDVADLGNLASNFGVTVGASWAQGDSDYNGAVNVADLGNLASSFGASLASGVAMASAAALRVSTEMRNATPSAGASPVQSKPITATLSGVSLLDDAIDPWWRRRHRNNTNDALD